MILRGLTFVIIFLIIVYSNRMMKSMQESHTVSAFFHSDCLILNVSIPLTQSDPVSAYESVNISRNGISSPVSFFNTTPLRESILINNITTVIPTIVFLNETEEEESWSDLVTHSMSNDNESMEEESVADETMEEESMSVDESERESEKNEGDEGEAEKNETMEERSINGDKGREEEIEKDNRNEEETVTEEEEEEELATTQSDSKIDLSHAINRKRLIPLNTIQSGSISQWRKFWPTFVAMHHRKVNSTEKVVYLKRGTTGIAGQMIGVCDSLFIAMRTGRALQFYSAILTSSLFSFPLSQLHLNDSTLSKSLIESYAPPLYSTPYSLTITGKNNPDPLSSPTYLLPPTVPLLMRTLHIMGDRFLNQNTNTIFLQRIGVLPGSKPVPRDRSHMYALVDLLYSRCVHSLFSPSPLVKSYLSKYETRLSTGIRIGVHIRMGAGYSDWTDSRQFLSERRLNMLIRSLKVYIEGHKKKNPNTKIRIFLSTDSSEIEKKMRLLFPKMIVTTQGWKRSHVGGVRATKYNENSIVKAVLDVMLLGKCDFLFLTKRSGFSKLGLYYAEEKTSFRVFSFVCSQQMIIMLGTKKPSKIPCQLF